MITLNGVVLPPGLVWKDLDYCKLKQSEHEGVTGKTVIQRGTMQDGRPITLESDGRAWLKRTEAETISALRVELDPLTLNYHGTEYKVRFVLSDASHFVTRGVFDELRMDEPETMCAITTMKLIEVDE